MIRPRFLLPLIVLLTCWKDVQGGAPDFNAKRWESPIPFAFDDRYSEEEKNIVRAVTRTIRDHTCIDFEENIPGPQLVYFLETDESTNCRSAIGDVRGESNQKIHLKRGCIHNFTIMHETIHALGILHTHVRFDRDDYVTVDANLIERDPLFRKEVKGAKTTDYGIPYEYMSIMHDFPTNLLVFKDTYYDSPAKVGMKHVTFNDWKLINMFYDCPAKCATQIDCHNGGYLHPRKCNECVCSQFYSGKQCDEQILETLVKGQKRSIFLGFPYDDSILKNSAQDDFNKSPATIIKAPEGSRIRVTIVDIVDVLSRRYMVPPKGCAMYPYEKAVEFVDGDLTKVGKRYCLESDKGYTFVTDTNVLGYFAYATKGLGFYATVTFAVEKSTLPTEDSIEDISPIND